MDGFSIDGYNIFQSNNKESKSYKSYICIMGCATFKLGQLPLPYSVFRTITSTFGFEESLFLQFYNVCDEVKFYEIVSINRE